MLFLRNIKEETMPTYKIVNKLSGSVTVMRFNSDEELMRYLKATNVDLTTQIACLPCLEKHVTINKV